MIGKRLDNEGANAALVIVLSGAVATLVARGPGRVSLGRILTAVLSNPVPRISPSGTAGQLRAPAAEERPAA